MDVPGTGDDLNGIFLAYVDLADPHVVGIGVTLHGDDLTNFHVGDLVSGAFPATNHGAGHGHVGGIFFGGYVMDAHIGEIFEPAIR